MAVTCSFQFSRIVSSIVPSTEISNRVDQNGSEVASSIEYPCNILCVRLLFILSAWLRYTLRHVPNPSINLMQKTNLTKPRVAFERARALAET